MEALVLIEDIAVRDAVLVGLRGVPGIHAESPAGYPDVDRARRRSYDAIFIDHDPNRGESVARLSRLRDLVPKAEIVVVADPRSTKALAEERNRLRIHGFLDIPIQVAEFFRLAVRLNRRIEVTAR